MRTLFNKKLSTLLAVCMMAGMVNAANWFVKGDGNTNTTGGSSWATAVTLSKAAGSAAAGDFIYLAKGTYNPVATITLGKAYTVIGGYNGDENELTITPELSNPKVNITNFTASGGQTFRVLNLGSSTNTGTLILSGISIDGYSSNQNGNALECPSSSVLDVEIKNCKFKNLSATATNHSGAININNVTANVSIQDCLFENITSGNNGGAISTNTKTGNSISIVGCTFKNTSVSTTTTTNYNGGAIFANGIVGTNAYTLNIDNCTFDGTKAATGGAIYAGVAITVNLTNSTLKNCSTVHLTAGNGHGGAIIFSSPIMNIINCKFDSNSDNGRGLIYWNAASTRTNIKKSIFINNTSQGTTQNSGAVFGIQNASSIVSIDSCYANSNNSTAHSTSMSASVLYSAAGKSNISIKNSAFVGNIGKSTVTRTVTFAAGATTGDTINIQNSIISNNTNLATNDTLRDVSSFSTTYGKAIYSNMIANGEYHSSVSNLSTPVIPLKTIYTNLLTPADMSSLTTPTTINDIVSATNVLLNKYVTGLTKLSTATARIHAANGQIYISNVDNGSKLSAYNAAGQLIHESVVNDGNYNFAANGFVVVKLSNSTNYQTLKVVSK
jgi:hypothetical protein